MKEFIIWARQNENDSPLDERPISEKVFDENENIRRVEIATANGWKHIRVQVIDYGKPYNAAAEISKAFRA